MLAYTKFTEAHFAFLDTLCSDHTSTEATLDHSVFRQMMDSFKEGLGALDQGKFGQVRALLRKVFASARAGSTANDAKRLTQEIPAMARRFLVEAKALRGRCTMLGKMMIRNGQYFKSSRNYHPHESLIHMMIHCGQIVKAYPPKQSVRFLVTSRNNSA